MDSRLAAAIREARAREAARQAGAGYRAALLGRPAAAPGSSQAAPGGARAPSLAPRSLPPAAAALAAALKTAGKGGKSALVRELVGLLEVAGLPPPRWAGSPEGELRPVPGRRFALDLAWPEVLVYCEVDGGAWSGGRHSRGSGIVTDCEKTSLLAGLGWRHVRVTVVSNRVQPQAVEWIAAALLWRPTRAAPES